MDAKDWIAVVALALSVVTLVWRIRDERASYLQIGLAMATPPGGRFAVARLTITNESVRIKKLSAAFLLVGPVDEDPIDTFNAALAGSAGSACCAIDFERLVPDEVAVDASGTRRVVPLSYFTEENDNVGDEELAYSFPIDLAEFPPATTLSIRFYVYGCRRGRQNYHRKVHDVLVVPAGPGSAPQGRDAECHRGPAAVSAQCRSIRGCPRRMRRT
jgi:hypothetical protein